MGTQERPRRALVVGASGQVGRSAARALADAGWAVTGTYASHPAPGLVALDLRDDAAVRALVRDVRPDLCLLSSALTHVDRCEDEPALAEALNARAPGVAAEACREVGARVLYLSTEYVFDGAAGPYGEDEPPCPPCVYGATKLEGERRVLAAAPDALALRTTVVFSFDPAGKNFVMQLRERLGAGQRMRVPLDQLSSPTYAPDLAAAIVALAPRREVAGVLNVVGPDVVDRLAFAVAAARALGLDEGLLDPVTTASLGQRARRPLRAGLRIDRLRGLGIPMRGVHDALADLARRAAAAAGGR
jgi:dTDP-4-dehydrorhamnose reductase